MLFAMLIRFLKICVSFNLIELEIICELGLEKAKKQKTGVQKFKTFEDFCEISKNTK